MVINCKKHGEVEATPDKNLNVFCPECLKEAVDCWNKEGNGLRTSLKFSASLKGEVRSEHDSTVSYSQP